MVGAKGRVVGDHGAETVCCLLCNASVLCFLEEGASKLKQHMRFEHGVAFNMQFMIAACRMNDAERESLVTIFEPKNQETSPNLQQAERERESPEITCVEEVNVDD